MQLSTRPLSPSLSGVTYPVHGGCRFAIAAWLGVLSLAFFLYTPEHAFVARETRSDVLHVQIAALCTLVALAVLGARLRILSGPTFSFLFLDRLNPHSLLSWFFLYCAILSVRAREPFLPSIVYAALTWLALVTSALSWPTRDNARKALVLASVVLTLVLAALLLTFGPPNGRLIGGNQPNALGQTAVVAIACGILSRSTIRIPIVAFNLVLIYLVDSRSSGLAVLMFAALFAMTPPYGRILPHPALRGVVFVGLSIGLWLFMILARQSALSSSLVEWLRLYDPESGLGSGMTGRTTLMAIALRSILQHPFLGQGFRMVFLEGGHSGYLALLGETGIIGGLLFLCAVGWTIALEWRRSHIPGLGRDERMISKVIVAFLGMNLLVLWPIEPLYISLGFPTQALVIYFLARPIYLNGTHRARLAVTTITDDRSIADRTIVTQQQG